LNSPCKAKIVLVFTDFFKDIFSSCTVPEKDTQKKKEEERIRQSV